MVWPVLARISELVVLKHTQHSANIIKPFHSSNILCLSDISVPFDGVLSDTWTVHMWSSSFIIGIPTSLGIEQLHIAFWSGLEWLSTSIYNNGLLNYSEQYTSEFHMIKGVAAYTQIRRYVLKFCQTDKLSINTFVFACLKFENRLRFQY